MGHGLLPGLKYAWKSIFSFLILWKILCSVLSFFGFGKDNNCLVVLEKTMTGRGGPRHHAKPYVDSGLLYKCLEKHQDLVRNLGPYEIISRSMGLDPKGLVTAMPLWKEILRVEPSGEIHAQPLRNALVKLLSEKPDLNASHQSGQVWANLKVERINCVLTHVRKLGRDKNFTYIAAKLVKEDYLKLLDGLKLLEVPCLEKGGSGPGELLAICDAPALEKAGEAKEEPGVLEKAKKRKLKAQSSEVSMDEQGFPKMFGSPENMKAPAASSSRLLVSKSRPGSRIHSENSSLRDSMGYGLKRPAAASGLEKPQKKAASGLEKPEKKAASGLEKPQKNPASGLEKPKAGKKKPAAREAAPQKETRKPWVKLRQVNPTNPERSYLQGKHEGGNMHLIIEVTAHRCPQYREVIEKIKAALEKDALTKAEAKQLREELCHKYGC